MAQQPPPPAPKLKFLKGVYTNASSPYGLLGAHNIDANFFNQVTQDPNAVQTLLTNVLGAFDADKAEADATLEATQDLEDQPEVKALFRTAVVKAGGNDKKTKSNFAKAFKTYAEQFTTMYVGPTWEMLQNLRFRKKSVADPFQKAALTHRIKIVDRVLTNVKKTLMSKMGVDVNALYARAAAGVRGGMEYGPAQDLNEYPAYKQFGDQYADIVDQRKERLKISGRRYSNAQGDRDLHILDALKDPNPRNLQKPMGFVPKKSRITELTKWTDPEHKNYLDYDPYSLTAQAFGDKYAAAKFLKYEGPDGKYKTLPRNLVNRFGAYQDEDEIFITVKKKNIKDAILATARQFLPPEVAKSVRIDPDLLTVLSECLDAYGRKLLAGLVIAYINLEGSVSKPSLKISLSHLMQLFNSPAGQEFVTAYQLGDIQSAFAAGQEDIQQWFTSFVPGMTNRVENRGKLFLEHVKLPKGKSFAQRYTDPADRLALVGNRRFVSQFNTRESLTPEFRQRMDNKTDADYALDLGRRAWEKKLDSLEDMLASRTAKISTTYSISEADAEKIALTDPVIRHFMTYGSYNDAVTNGVNKRFYASLADMNNAVAATDQIKSKYAGLSLKGLDASRRHEAGIIRSLYRQSKLQGVNLHVTTSAQWFATCLTVGVDANSRKRVIDSFVSLGLPNADTVEQLISENGAAYFTAANNLILTPNVYLNLQKAYNNPNVFWNDPNTPPPEGFLQIVATPGVFDFAVHMALLQILDQLKYTSVDKVLPKLMGNTEAYRQVKKFFRDELEVSEVFTMHHGQSVVSAYDRFNILQKAASKEYDLVVKTLQRATTRDERALEVFGASVMKLPRVSKLVSILFGMSKTMRDLFAIGPSWAIAVDLIIAQIMSDLSGDQKRNYKVAQLVIDELYRKDSALESSRKAYHGYAAKDIQYAKTKEQREERKNARERLKQFHTTFLTQKPRLTKLKPYQRRRIPEGLTEEELEGLQAKSDLLNQQFGNNEVEMGGQ